MEFELFCEKQARVLAAEASPRLSWRPRRNPNAPDRNFVQSAYRICVASAAARLETPDLWDSGWVESAQSEDVALAAPLASNARIWWCVRVKDAYGATHVSLPAWFETGLRPEDWRGEWIGAGTAYRTNWAMLYRREFRVSGEIERAKAFVSGLGCYELSLNGERVGDHELDPAQTEYPQRIFYTALDVTEALRQGGNAVGVVLGDGWYHQSLLMDGGGIYGDPCLRFQLEIVYKSGNTQRIVSDGGWRVAPSPISHNNIYCGETYDGRFEQPGWDTYGFPDAQWTQAVPDNAPKGELVAQLMPPMRVTEVIRPVSVTMPQAGVYVFDMGVNFAGSVELITAGSPGREITLRFAECIGADGMLDYDSTGVFHIQQIQSLRYVFGKRGEIRWRPKFCYFGFRYVEVTGLPFEELGKLPTKAIDSLLGLRIHSDLAETAEFTCSLPILNELHTMFQNTFLSNVHGIPTDCPAREKCGWTGDANVICDTASILWDTQLFFEKYVQDIVDSYKEYGVYRNIAPGKRGCGETVPPWGAALVLIPWYLYEEYGSLSTLRRFYADMQAYVAHMEKGVVDGVYLQKADYALADWCAPYGYDSATHYVATACAYYYKSLCVMAQSAALLDRHEEAASYAQKAELCREKYPGAFYDFEAHSYGTQTLNAFCDALGLTPPGEAEAMARWTMEDIRARGGHISCGHIGMRFIFRYIADCGEFALLESVLTARDYPSFGAQIALGATTLWETFETGTHGLSLNHPFRGGYCHWLYGDVLGIRKAAPGYAKICIQPKATQLVASAKGCLRTVRGLISVDFRVGEYFHVEIPPNTTAEVYVPDGKGGYTRHELGSGVHSL